MSSRKKKVPICPHFALAFMELHDGAIKMACGQCQKHIILNKVEEQGVRKAFERLNAPLM